MKTRQKVLSFLLALMVVFGAGLTVCAVDGGESAEPTVKIANSEREVTLNYKQSKTFEFEAQDLPEGAAVHVFYNGEDRGEGTYINVEDPTEDFTVEAKILDKDGNVIAVSGEVRVTVRNGFFDRLKDFFKNTFGRAADGVMDVLSAIFMRIWIFLHR